MVKARPHDPAPTLAVKTTALKKVFHEQELRCVAG